MTISRKDEQVDELEATLDAKKRDAEELWKRLDRDAQMYSTPLFSVKKTDQGDVLKAGGLRNVIGERRCPLHSHRDLNSSSYLS
jgi:hypothetical protein